MVYNTGLKPHLFCYAALIQVVPRWLRSTFDSGLSLRFAFIYRPWQNDSGQNNTHTTHTHTTCTHSHIWEHTPTNTHDHTLESRHMYSHAQIHIHMGTHTRMPAHILTHTLSQIHTSKHTHNRTDTRTAQFLSLFLFLSSISLIQSSLWCFLHSTSFSSYLSSFLKKNVLLSHFLTPGSVEQ